VRIHANQIEVSRLIATLREDGVSPDGWVTFFVEESTGQRWRRTFLSSEFHGGGMPVLITEPSPTVPELLDLVADSSDPAEIAAGAWLLSEVDPEGGYKEPLVTLAERMASQNDQVRAALLVGWGNLLDEMNLRRSFGKPPAQVTSDHAHFKEIAARARRLLQLESPDPRLRDLRIFQL
jgi:hypothetical protein